MVHPSGVLSDMCERLSRGALGEAQALARERYPASLRPASRRAFTPTDLVRTALRDGFIDRYSGERTVFPGTLRLLSVLLPAELPFHPNWAYDRCHPMYWELYPTLDQVLPVARGGIDAPENWVTTSQRMSAAKALWTLDELGWSLHPAGDLRAWDGLMSWFLAYTASHSAVCRQHRFLYAWRKVARAVSRL